MGVRMIFLNYLEQKGIFEKGSRVLDVGAQNLYLALQKDIENFIVKYNPQFPNNELGTFSAKLENGSAMVNGGFLNNSFLSDLLIAAGMKYQSLDLFEQKHNLIVDLNHYVLDRKLKSKHDIVLNFGTTEHVFNQYNCFKIIHEATKEDGYMFHQLPSTGYMDHGFFVYCPHFFVNLAEANDYEIIDMWIAGPYDKTKGIFDLIKKYEKEEVMCQGNQPDEHFGDWEDLAVPGSEINVLFKKKKNAAFTAGLDLSTTISRNLIPKRILNRSRFPSNIENWGLSKFQKLFKKLQKIFKIT